MRRILVASLMSTLALAAAAATPKPNANSAAPVLAATRPVSTGITGPRLSSHPSITVYDAALAGNTLPVRMLLHVNLDAAGKTTAVQVLHSISPAVDAQVVAAVRHFQWQPAQLDYQKIPMAVDLIVNVQPESR